MSNFYENEYPHLREGLLEFVRKHKLSSDELAKIEPAANLISWLNDPPSPDEIASGVRADLDDAEKAKINEARTWLLSRLGTLEAADYILNSHFEVLKEAEMKIKEEEDFAANTERTKAGKIKATYPNLLQCFYLENWLFDYRSSREFGYLPTTGDSVPYIFVYDLPEVEGLPWTEKKHSEVTTDICRIVRNHFVKKHGVAFSVPSIREAILSLCAEGRALYEKEDRMWKQRKKEREQRKRESCSTSSVS